MIKKGSRQQDLTYLSSYICKVMKKMFGKGPESCTIASENNLVIAKVQQFITPAEEVLLNRNELSLALKFRTTLLKAFFEETQEELSTMTDLVLDSFYHDWDYETNHGLLIFAAGQSFSVDDNNEGDVFTSALRDQVKLISSKVHSEPNFVNLRIVHPTIYIVECVGGLVEQEQKNEIFLVEKSQEIRKNYKRFSKELESTFNCLIQNLFITWSYAKDKYYLVIYLK
ncbi:Na-translocating system protein MpsC family protein [Halalkalibacter kiskunsagensis]|uniref:Na-translocating system protein MpsC family protein n=1 Tax=Halalkalibacter kiskunsagensis TaxID=1548599 RepID=A0ABV6KDS9_9BACI